MDGRRDTGRRTLCVPVRRPRHLTLLGRAAVAGAGACAATAAWWQAGPPGLAVLGAAAAAGATARRAAGRRRAPIGRIRAIRAGAGSRRWQVRLERRWHAAILRDSRRGACWLDLRLSIEPAAGRAVTNGRVTVWRSCMSAVRWRRLCLLAGAAQRLDVPVRGAP